ncbi:hypothetical protein RND71_008505 [Anisodus tanguticus]|uniref:Uncharacterized protein n=1 Tax=Anisodus tanguticus TaxID=243964 RepID=A0AAE1VQS9_9SOLA|nr:hypothetical protein RND71_008505 [Anisodus tanguticus]
MATKLRARLNDDDPKIDIITPKRTTKQDKEEAPKRAKEPITISPVDVPPASTTPLVIPQQTGKSGMTTLPYTSNSNHNAAAPSPKAKVDATPTPHVSHKAKVDATPTPYVSPTIDVDSDIVDKSTPHIIDVDLIPQVAPVISPTDGFSACLVEGGEVDG